MARASAALSGLVRYFASQPVVTLTLHHRLISGVPPGQICYSSRIRSGGCATKPPEHYAVFTTNTFRRTQRRRLPETPRTLPERFSCGGVLPDSRCTCAQPRVGMLRNLPARQTAPALKGRQMCVASVAPVGACGIFARRSGGSAEAPPPANLRSAFGTKKRVIKIAFSFRFLIAPGREYRQAKSRILHFFDFAREIFH